MPEIFYTSDEITGLLDHPWTVEVSEARPRLANTPDGVEVQFASASWWPPDDQSQGRRRDAPQARQIGEFWALRSLESQGLVTMRPGRGAVVLRWIWAT